MKKQALVTLVIGRDYQRMFEKWFLQGWERYCALHGLGLVVIDRPLDESPRAKGRSPAWQKCIVHHHSELARFDRVAWVDADIMIRPDAPNIFADVPERSIGAVNAYATPTKEDHNMLLRRICHDWDRAGVRYVSNLTPSEYHGRFGLPPIATDGVVQTGVIVFTPHLYADIFQYTYDTYEDRGDASWNYEMRPLSYELIKSGAVHWMSPKFNMVWTNYQQLHFPFLNDSPSPLARAWRRIAPQAAMSLRRRCVEVAFHNNYFLHFAGGSQDFRLVSGNIAVR